MYKILLTLTVISVFGFVSLGCEAVQNPPPEDVRLADDIPLPADFVFAPDNPAPKTNYEGKRFARYGHVRNTPFDAVAAAAFYAKQLPKHGWNLLEESAWDGETWKSRWRKERDVLLVTYTRESVTIDDELVMQSHILIELNTH